MIFVVRFRRKATWRIVFGCVEQKSNHLRLSEKPSQVIKGHIHRPQHRYQYTPHTPSQPLVLVQCYPRTACRTRYIPISTNSSKVPFLTQQRTTVISLCSETTFSFKCIVLVMMAPDHGRYVLCVVVCQCVILQCQVVCEDKERRKEVIFFFSVLASTQLPKVVHRRSFVNPFSQELSTGVVKGTAVFGTKFIMLIRHQKLVCCCCVLLN